MYFKICLRKYLRKNKEHLKAVYHSFEICIPYVKFFNSNVFFGSYIGSSILICKLNFHLNHVLMLVIKLALKFAQSLSSFFCE